VHTIPSTNVSAAFHAAIHQPNQPIKPEWLRIPDAVRVFGISRSSLYEMITAGSIKSTVLRKRGALRGIRILSFDSLAEYCERSAKTEGGKL
jgi:hypothetical protein